MIRFLFVVLFLGLGLLGCQTSGPGKNHTEARTAIQSVAGAITQNSRSVKYCPVCGRHFSPSVAVCPHDKETLKSIEEEP